MMGVRCGYKRCNSKMASFNGCHLSMSHMLPFFALDVSL